MHAFRLSRVLPAWIVLCSHLGTATAAQPVSFELDVQPILASSGCSTGPCHGKARGQNGFQLSLFGFDPEFDHAALTKEGRGRRVFWAAPDESLLLKKATAQLPHGGGQRFGVDSPKYALLLDWIAAGAPRRLPSEPKLLRVEASPAEQLMRPNEQFQLEITAHYSDGSQRDVTSMAMYQSNESAIVGVGSTGLIKAGSLPGEASIMARFMNIFATCNVAIPLPGKVPQEVYSELPRHNLIDELVWDKLRVMGITPSEPVEDAKYMRRVHIDIIGTLPSPQEVRTFLADTDSGKRNKLVDRLLERPEYVDHWANKWADLLRPNPYRVGIKAVLNYDNWIRESFRQNKPYDQFVRELLTAQGSTWHNGAATLYRDRRSPDEITTLVTQLFLGIRLECAKCHHHPFEKWAQSDFYSFAAYFARVGRKGGGLSPPISGSEEIILTAAKGRVTHPLTGATMQARPLFGAARETNADADPREALADWVTSPENEFFAQVIANRIWADLMGRGLVEPIDDLRATNPPSNGPLLEALANDLRQREFDLKELIRTITTSYVYSLSSTPTARNVADTRNYARHYRQRLRAEVLLDTVSEITGVPDSFAAMPPGSRAKEIWTHRIGSLFLDTFGRPDPNKDPPCERLEDSTVTQALHMMNSTILHEKVTADKGRAAQLAASTQSPEQIVEQIYLLAYGRFPDEQERDVGRELFGSEPKKRRHATEDLLWALMNTPEFLFKD